MSFVEGTKILGVGRTRSDPKRMARLGLQALLKMVFADGFVHADLHPGNIFVDDTGRAVILDLGLPRELDEAARRAFALFFASWAGRNGKVMAKLMSDLSPSSHVADYAAYEREV